MNEGSRRAPKFDLNRAALDQLLYALDPDRDRAAEEYEALRQRLVHFFELRWPVSAEDLADEALNRLAKRLSEGQEIQQIPRYLLGIAKLLLREKAKERRAQIAPGLETLAGKEPDTHDELQQAFDACFEELSPENRQLVEVYYGGEGAARIQNRTRLANQIGISLNALRNRVFRLRAAMEQCIEKRVTAARDISSHLTNKE